MGTIRILNHGSTNKCFEKLALQDDLLAVMDIVWLKTKFLEHGLLSLLFMLLLFFFIRTRVALISIPSRLGLLLVLNIVQMVELVHIVGSQQSEMVLLTLIINPVELGEGAV